jgi:hypothetical protein
VRAFLSSARGFSRVPSGSGIGFIDYLITIALR